MLQILKILWRNKSWVKNTKKMILDQTSGLDLGYWEPELMGKFYVKKILPQLCMFK